MYIGTEMEFDELGVCLEIVDGVLFDGNAFKASYSCL